MSREKRRKVKVAAPAATKGGTWIAGRIWPALRWDWVVALFSLLLLCQAATDGQWNFFPPPGRLQTFYDAQARSLLAGRIDVPLAAIETEAFVRNGKYYGYFGPTPALARIPLNLLFPGMYGRWNRLSMLLGSVLIMAVLILLFRKLEELLPLKGALWGVLRASLLIATALGSTNLFLSTESLMYQEAIMWGSALTLAQAVFLVCYLLDPKSKWLALTCVAAVLAFLARVSSGAGAVFSLLLLDVVLLMPSGRVREFLGVPALPSPRRAITALTATLLVSGSLWAGLNYWKFGMPFASQPLSMTIASDPERLQRTKGDAFSIANLPLTLSVYYSPSNVSFQSAFPWVYLTPPDQSLASRFPKSHFDRIEAVASLPCTVPGLLLGALAGTGLCFFLRRRPLPMFRIPLIGTFVAGSLMLGWGYITYRYLQDALPWLVLGSALAVASIPLLSRQWTRTAVTALLLAALAYGVWVNFAFSVVHQRFELFPRSDEDRIAFTDFAAAISQSGPRGALDYLTHRRTYIGAGNLVRGNVDVYNGVFTLNGDSFVVRRDGPPPGVAEYQIDVPRDGVYQISLLYASGEPRPLRFFFDGREVLHSVCAEPTGGWDAANERWAVIGSFRVRGGSRDLSLVSDGKFPVVRMIRLVRTG
jgi:hypothetical protein